MLTGNDLQSPERFCRCTGAKESAMSNFPDCVDLWEQLP